MQEHFTVHQLEVMRRAAKKKASEDGTILAKALDLMAQEHGYGNWSLLQKNGAIPADQPQPYLFRRTSEEMASALRVLPDKRFPWDHRPRSDIARDSVESLEHKFVNAANALDFAIGYVECLLLQPRFQLRTQAVVYWEMRCWLPYGAHPVDFPAGSAHILVNRYYKPQGAASRDYVDYSRYPQLHIKLHGEAWRLFSHRTAKDPFLFNDGSAPWHSREHAKRYLDRLYELRKQA